MVGLVVWFAVYIVVMVLRFVITYFGIAAIGLLVVDTIYVIWVYVLSRVKWYWFMVADYVFMDFGCFLLLFVRLGCLVGGSLLLISIC